MRCASCGRRLPAGTPCPLHPDERPPVDAPAAPASPPEIEGFVDWSLLGRGGFSHVFAARRADDGLEVAIKVALRAGDERFERERAALHRLGPPITPGLLAHGVSGDGRPYLVMERLHGSSLAEWMAQKNVVHPPAVLPGLPVFRRLCALVESVHAHGMVHRDLKPENVWLADDATLRLLDFGLVRQRTGPEMDVQVTRHGTGVGTITYMAPEQFCDATVIDWRADLYALGAILFELLTGRPPFVGPANSVERDHLLARVPLASRLAPLSPAVDATLRKALEKDPALRFQTAGDLARAVEEALAGGNQPAVAPGEREQPRAGVVRRSVALLAVLPEQPLDACMQTVAPDGAEIAFSSPQRYVFAFPHAANASVGLRAAVRAAERLSAAAGMRVVHCAELIVRNGPRRTSMIGDAVEHHERWWPSVDERRTLLTRTAAEGFGLGGTEPAAAAGFFRVGLKDVRLPTEIEPARQSLHGRDVLLTSLVERAEECRATTTPALSTLVGDPGMGKSRLLGALADALAARDWRVVSIGATLPESGSAETVSRGLWAATLGLTAASTVDEIRAVSARHFGAEAEALWPAIALTLGAVDRPAALPAALRAAGSVRREVAFGIGASLKRLAAERPTALLIDDAQWADPAALDAIELATAGVGVPLWVCVAARPALMKSRASWSKDRPQRHVQTLAPLTRETAADLVRELLRPAEFVSASVLDRIVDQTGCVPLYAVELCRALRKGGAIRRHPGSDAWYVAGDELLNVAPTSLQEVLATRAQAMLSPSLVALARLCSVLGDQVEIHDVKRAVAISERDFADAEWTADIDAGLRRLAHDGVLEATARGFRFRNPTLRRAVEEATPDGQRRQLHEACRRLLVDDPALDTGGKLRLARHSAAAGHSAAAAKVYLDLADEARLHNRWLDAEQHYGAAFEMLDESDRRTRLRVLLARGEVRYHIGLLRESLDQLRRARTLAEQLQDGHAVAEAMLEAATVLDWLEDYSASREVTLEMGQLVDCLQDPVIDARWTMAHARTLFREGPEWTAIDELQLALDKANRVEHYGTQVICLLLLPYALLLRGRLAEAEELAGAAIALCERAGDRVHLAAAYVNRIYLWMMLGSKERALDDHRVALRLAREFGLAKVASHASQLECEILMHFGDWQRADSAAAEAVDLETRYGTPNADLLVLAVRVSCAGGALERARQARARLSAKDLCNLTQAARFLLTLVDAHLGDAPRDADGWLTLLASRPKHLIVSENLEAHYWVAAGLAKLGARDRLDELMVAVRALDGYRVWQERFARL